MVAVRRPFIFPFSTDKVNMLSIILCQIDLSHLSFPARTQVLDLMTLNLLPCGSSIIRILVQNAEYQILCLPTCISISLLDIDMVKKLMYQ